MAVVNTVLYIELKGQCHEIFCIRVFLWIILPQARENNIRVISNFFENSEIFACQGAPPVSTKLAVNFPTGSASVVVITGGK